MIDTMLRDIRYALRLLRLSPAFALVAIVSLALGTGANTAIFQLLDAILLRTLPVQAPQELVEIRVDDMTHARGSWYRDAALTNPLWERVRDRKQAFLETFAWADESLDMSASGEFRGVAGLWVSGDFFRVLGVKPILGRVFTESDDRRGCGFTPGAVISYGFWQREFGGDASVIGRRVPMGKGQIEVIGVTPPGFFGLEVGRTFDIALPICSEPAWQGISGRLDSGTIWWLTVMGRLKPGVSTEQAGAFFQANSAGIFQTTLPADYPPASRKPYLAMKLITIPAGHGISRLRTRYSKPLALLLAIAGLVLLIACVNLANLILARGSARQREIAVRLAVGASRTRLACLLVSEGLLLAVAGAALGLLLARVLSRFLVSFLATSNDATSVELPQDLHIFGFAAGLAILTCLVFTAAPVLRAVRTDPGEALKAGGRAVTSGRERAGIRRVLVASQIAVSLVLLVGTLLFLESFRNLSKLDPGFDRHGLLVVDIDFLELHLTPGGVVSFRREILERLRAIPGVESAAEMVAIPLSGGSASNRIWVDGSDSAHARVSLLGSIGTEYFRTMKMPLLAGRAIDEHDLTALAKVAVVNQEFAREFTGGLNPVGKRLWMEATPYRPQTAFEIVGLVKNTKYRDLREEFQPLAFVPLSQATQQRSGARFMIRSGGRVDALVSPVRKTLTGMSPGIRYLFHEFDRWVQDSVLRERLMATLSTLFGVLALVLTAIGLYGVMSYTVARRTNEIGVRIAVGADRGAVIALILREAATVLAAGLSAGILLALAAGRAAAALLFGLAPSDPLAIALACVSLTIVAAAASSLPAWRAASVNPVSALRQD